MPDDAGGTTRASDLLHTSAAPSTPASGPVEVTDSAIFSSQPDSGGPAGRESTHLDTAASAAVASRIHTTASETTSSPISSISTASSPSSRSGTSPRVSAVAATANGPPRTSRANSKPGYIPTSARRSVTSGLKLENIIWASDDAGGDGAGADGDTGDGGRRRSSRRSTGTTSGPAAAAADSPSLSARATRAAAGTPRTRTHRPTASSPAVAAASAPPRGRPRGRASRGSNGTQDGVAEPSSPSPSIAAPTPHSSSSSGLPPAVATADPRLAALRARWEFAAVAQFFHLFSDSLHLSWDEDAPATAAIADHTAFAYAEPPLLGSYSYPVAPLKKNGRQSKAPEKMFETEDLEQHLLSSDPPQAFLELHVKLLRVLTLNRFISLENWSDYFRREGERLGHHDAVDIFPEGVSYTELPDVSKLLVLHCLCEWQLDLPDRFRLSTRSDSEMQHWVYNRLYREEPLWIRVRKRRGVARSSSQAAVATLSAASSSAVVDELAAAAAATGVTRKWELVCLAAEHWKALPAYFARSKHDVERDFHKFLVSFALPKVLPDLEEKARRKVEAEEARERQRRMDDAMLHRKRSSRLQIKQIERMEEERRAAEERARAKEEERQRELEARNVHKRLRSVGHLASPADRTRAPSADTTASRDREERLRKRRRLTDGPDAYAGQVDDGDASFSVGRSSPAVSGSRGAAPAAADGEEDPWFFDCACGVRGYNIDDGRPMIACGRCGNWQHLACAAAAAPDADRPPDPSAWEAADYACHRCTVAAAAVAGPRPASPENVAAEVGAGAAEDNVAALAGAVSAGAAATSATEGEGLVVGTLVGTTGGGGSGRGVDMALDPGTRDPAVAAGVMA
ncbi:hypothetical protein HK405_009055, partial [Cladochytrium tenue]